MTVQILSPMIRFFLGRAVPGIILVVGLHLQAATPPPFDPSQFQLDPQLEITRWAAEPDVIDPVALCFDDAGRAYVAECRDYPSGAGPNGAVGSTIRLLEDLDGDGKPDRVTLFAEGLSYVTSVTPWRGGVLVAAPPEILFLKDTNGDGRADVREVVLTGFKRGVSDSLVNGLRLHLDGRIHGANGGNNGVIASPRWSETLKADGPIDLRDHDFSFNPDTGDLALTRRTGGGFGQVFDEFGHAFTTYNINHIQYCYLPRRYVERQSGLPTDHLTVGISDHGEMSPIFPISIAQTRPNHPEQSGHFSAAGGMGYLSSPNWPLEFSGSVFVCDVVGNIVHRDLIREVPGGWLATRSTNELEREFLASRDPNFRPVALENGPDGALYLLALQREVIEHPDYIPAPMRQKLDLRAGADRGRIYRITPRAGLNPVKPRLAQMKNAELVPLLAHDEIWWRTTAQRLLIERQATDVAGQIRVLARDPRSALGRIHALWTLQNLGSMLPGDVTNALDDGNAGVRENALLLSEPLLTENASVVQKVVLLLNDRSAQVRYQCLLTMGLVSSPMTVSAVSDQLYRYPSNPRVRIAVLIALHPSALAALVQNTLRIHDCGMAKSGPWPPFFREYSEVMGARAESRPKDLTTTLKRLATGLSEKVRMAVLEGFVVGLERSGSQPALTGAAADLADLATGAPATRLPVLWKLTRLCGLPDSAPLLAALPRARTKAAQLGTEVLERRAHLALLEFDPTPEATSILLNCLAGTELPEIQDAAVAALRRRTDPGLGTELVNHWRALAPTVRSRAIQLLLDRSAFHAPLVAAWEAGTLTVGEFNLDLEQRRRLLNTGPAELRTRAQKFLGDGEYANRAGIVSEWLAKLPTTGNPESGRKLFESDCAKCHRCGVIGKSVGPELSAVAHRSAEDLLANILDPNMAVNPGFITYTVETREGEVQTGLLLAQNSTTVTLVQADEQFVAIPRKDITKIESTGRSLMPEGLEQGKTPQNLRDLIAFLQAKH